jgi:hypothetical protein
VGLIGEEQPPFLPLPIKVSEKNIKVYPYWIRYAQSRCGRYKSTKRL